MNGPPHPYLAAFRWFLQRHPWWFAAWRIALTLLGRATLFWRRPKITAEQICQARRRLLPGDVLGVKSERFLTCWLLPRGRWDVEHSAIYLGGGMVVEAVTPRVRRIGLTEFLGQYDRAVVGHPRGPYDGRAAAKRAQDLVGVPYDVLFQDGHRALYCHETCAVAMAAGGQAVGRAGACYLFDDLVAACGVVFEV